MTEPKLTRAQEKTLHTLVARGGEMNGYAGQPGFYGRSVGALLRLKLVEQVDSCQGCDNDQECERPLAEQAGGERCYLRVRVTMAGREVA